MKWFHFAGVWFAILRAEQAILAAEPKAMAGLTEEMKQLPAAECMQVMQGHATLCKWQYSVLLNCIIFYIISSCIRAVQVTVALLQCLSNQSSFRLSPFKPSSALFLRLLRWFKAFNISAWKIALWAANSGQVSGVSCPCRTITGLLRFDVRSAISL